MPVQSQANTLMEVASGTSDAAVIDVLMAAEMTGEGTSYGDLVYDLNLNEHQEQRHLSSTAWASARALTWWMLSTTFWKQAVADGTV